MLLICLFVVMSVWLDWHAFFFHSSGREQDFCMLCTMETHINQALRCTVDAIEPTRVINNLSRKWLQMCFFFRIL